MTCSGQNARGTWLKVLAINTKYGYVDLPLLREEQNEFLELCDLRRFPKCMSCVCVGCQLAQLFALLPDLFWQF